MFRFLAPKETYHLRPTTATRSVVDLRGKLYETRLWGGRGDRVQEQRREVFLDVRYNYNLTSLDDFGASFENDTIFHGVIASVGFLF